MQRQRMISVWRLVAFTVVFAAIGARPALCATATDVFPAQPRIPARTFNLLDYGGNPDGVTLNTGAFQRVVAACARAGGGTIRVPRGRFLTGRFSLGSCVCLHLDRGAVILFPPDSDTASPSGRGRSYLLSTYNCHDVVLSGQGTIDGQGSAAWARFRAVRDPIRETAKRTGKPAPDVPDTRPFMVGFANCQRVKVEGITLTNSPMFHLVPQHCTDVTIAGIRILAPENAPNTDGIDPAECCTVRITRCHIDTGDDCIAIKAGPGPSRDFTIADCTFLHGHGMSIGSGTTGGLHGMTVRHCRFDGTGAGIRLKAARDRGGLVEDLVYTDLRMRHVKSPIQITSYYPKVPNPDQSDPSRPVTALTPIWRDILIRNVSAVDNDTVGVIIGVPEMPVSNVTLENVRISAKTGLRLRNVQGLRMVNTQITSERGAPLLEESNVEGLTRAEEATATSR